MKQCPECRRTFTDDNLQFCLYDGKPLTPVSAGAAPLPTAPPRPKSPALIIAGVLGGVGCLVVALVIVAVVGLRAVVARGHAITSPPTVGPVTDPGQSPPNQDAVKADLIAAVQKADEAERQSYYQLDPAPLYQNYTGDALQGELTNLNALKSRGEFMDNHLQGQQFQAFSLTPDGSEAQVQVTETWNSTFCSAATRQPLRSTTANAPQTIHFKHTDSGWVVEHIDHG